MKKKMFAVLMAAAMAGTMAMTVSAAGREDRSDHNGFYRPALDQPE